MSTVQQTPTVPPRPSGSPVKDAQNDVPLIPPRPANRHVERSRSPISSRFAQSPLNGGINPRTSHASLLSEHGGPAEADGHDNLIDLSGNNLSMPSVGQEGVEYSVVARELEKEEASPEQTRTVAHDLKLHAPKPSLPAESAKQRLMVVTRTSSEKAASFGIGKLGYPDERAASRDGLRKKPSTAFSTTSEQAHLTDDEHGIPEIGQRVPMNPHLGDVQAPSPVPGLPAGHHSRNHSRRLSARGLPPGSYGMHGHGLVSQDDLDKAYYKKHPEKLVREQHTPLHDRHNDFAMSSSDLNKLVRDTASRAADRAGLSEYRGTPADEVAYRASDEYARASTLQDLNQAISPGENDRTIHVNDPKHLEYYSYGAQVDSPIDNEGDEYNAPILASDEVDRAPQNQVQHPVVRPRLERNDSSYSLDGRPNSRPTSRPSSRPTSVYNTLPIFDHTRLEDVEEYEPLFPEEPAKNDQEQPAGRKARHHFPSKDVWEDAPHSVYETTEVSTPNDVTEESPQKRSSADWESLPVTPAHAFALQHEELAEKEANNRKHHPLPVTEEKTKPERPKSAKPEANRRFPSKDVWEDAPESSLYEAEITESRDHDGKPEVPVRPMKKTQGLLRPSVPERPKSRAGAKKDGPARAAEQPAQMPQVPPRPGRKASGDTAKGDESPRPRSAAGVRPVGDRIAALQAGFMSDLNKRLQLGPQAAKKEEPVQHDAPAEEREKVPLVDARKGRARGPQRRAPTRAPAVATITEESARAEAALSMVRAQTLWRIDEDGEFVFASQEKAEEVPAEISRESPTEVPTEVPVPEAKPEEPTTGSEDIQEEEQKAVETETLDAERVASEEVEEPERSGEDVEPVASKEAEHEKTEETAEETVEQEVVEPPAAIDEDEREALLAGEKDVEEPEENVAHPASASKVMENSKEVEEPSESPLASTSKGVEELKDSEDSDGSNPFDDASESRESGQGAKAEKSQDSVAAHLLQGAESSAGREDREREDDKEEEVDDGSEGGVKGVDAASGAEDSGKASWSGVEMAQETEAPLEKVMTSEKPLKDSGTSILEMPKGGDGKHEGRDDTDGGVKI